MAEPERPAGEAESGRILIVDDEPASVDALRGILVQAGHRDLVWTTDPREVLQLCLWNAPDLILIDLHMPGLAGDQVLQRLRAEIPPEEGYLPVIVLTGDVTPTARARAFSAGARDFLTKPYDREEVLMRIRSHLEVRRIHRTIQMENRSLEEVIRQQLAELHRTQIELLDRLARAAEYRDDDTGEHAQRVGRMSARIASELGVGAERVDLIWRAAALHDLGKIGISDLVLLKPGKLSDEEMDTMRTHVRIGADILSGGTSRYLQVAELIALTHHEWWNGNGYLGMVGEEIPIEGRIVAVADVFDALTHERPYKEAWPIERALDHMVRSSGSHFDPQVVDAFLRVLEADGLLPDGIADLAPRHPAA